jgi:hypothetical protein
MTNPMDYGYSGNEEVTITAAEFMLLKRAVEHGINATLETFLPEVTKYVNIETSELVDEFTEEDLTSGKVVLVTDREATFSPKNVKYQYNTKLTPDMIQSQELIMNIHERNIEKGVAKTVQELESLKEEKK